MIHQTLLKLSEEGSLKEHFEYCPLKSSLVCQQTLAPQHVYNYHETKKQSEHIQITYLHKYYDSISPLCSKLINGSRCTVLLALLGPEQSLLRFLHLFLTSFLLLLPLLFEATLDFKPHLECLSVFMPRAKNKQTKTLWDQERKYNVHTMSKQRQP